ncbi:uncharacterized protein [Hoplias malabaricus]|uniref:uncharacterized protein isoform X2 n=1 Tax=Hoplias malabaricus TaxID=27720 RepID=UPI003461DBAD
MQQEELTDQQGIPLCGGISLFHSVVDGKHCYEVGNILTKKPSTFARKKDKLLMLNNMETKDLPPENFVKLLSSGSPNLTIYKAATDEATKECMETDTIQPYHKEYITLTFKMAMVSQESLEQGEEDRTELTECEWENDDMEYSKELVLISMSKTRVAVLKERGCDPEHPCNNYGIGGCNFSNVVLAAEKCEVTTVHRQCIKKRSEQTLLIRSYLDTTIDYEAISPGRRNICEDKATSEQITVYYYISTAPSKGAPVVLNFTATNNYLKCVCDDKKIVLTIELPERLGRSK